MKRDYVLLFIALALMSFLLFAQAVELNNSELNNSQNNTDNSSTTNATLENLKECRAACDTIHKNETRTCNLEYKNAAKLCDDQRKVNILSCGNLTGQDRLQCRRNVQMQNKVCRKTATDNKKACLVNDRVNKNVCRLSCLISGNSSSCQTYDDFSTALNNSKWNESGDLEERGVNETLGVYHTAQLNGDDKMSMLKISRTFAPNETIEYDVNYVSGTGNRRHTVDLDGFNDWSLFGFWNASEVGVSNDLGLYHVKIVFSDQGAMDLITLPNGTITSTQPDGNLSSPALTHTFGLVTDTGENGTVEMNYDNVKICTA